MKRNIKCYNKQVTVDSDFNKNIKQWLEKEADMHGLRWLLAHAYDGVIWGEKRENGLHFSSFLLKPDLRVSTLQMARLFSENGELLIWRTDNGWQARLVKDNEGEVKEYYDDFQLLWGTEVEKSDDGFVLLRHGSEGLRHAPPFKSKDNKLRLQINVRHYINYDPDGQAYVDFSRLISVEAFNEKEVM
jgi:CRISPR-associated protein (TIGR03984 family)